jgi:NAD(P)-dependent dehydrogenase (short-subunit alcohol dehydrogenase family)
VRDVFRLDGQVAVVTGLLGRLGPIWADALLGAGAVVVGLDLPRSKASSAFEGLKQRYGEHKLYLHRIDIRDRAKLTEVLDHCLTQIGIPSVLVNNAGIDQPPGPVQTYRLEDIPLDICRDVFDVNVLGALQATQIFGREMLKARRGTIINIGSLYASVSPDVHFYDHIPCDPPFLKPPAYGASKAALVNLTKYFAAHWGPYGVRVNILSPGGVLGEQDEAFKKKFSARVPMGRLALHSDLYGPLIFLASDASSYVTGIDLKIDGGFTAW